jgi:two-component system, cell cycle sensor histidine kinase and response regulator CckA
MEQVLVNLAVNARDAMPKGGSLVIRTSCQQVDGTTEKYSPQARAGRSVCLVVSDTGCGIPPEDLPHIFEPFFTTKPVGKGTGLGLALVYGIVEKHGGWIDVKSEVGKGSSFSIYLPAAASEDGSATPQPEEAKVSGGNETILLVEDETPVRSLARKILERYGYQVLEAASGPAGLEIWQDHQHQINLLVTDLVMPGGMTGIELAQRLWAQQPSLRVIYSTGYSKELLDQEPDSIKGHHVLTKPYAPLQLARLVREVLDAPA